MRIKYALPKVQPGAQHPVVKILDANSRVFAKNVSGIENLLQVRETHVPRALLARDGQLQRSGSGAVAAAGIEESKLDSFHTLRG